MNRGMSDTVYFCNGTNENSRKEENMSYKKIKWINKGDNSKNDLHYLAWAWLYIVQWWLTDGVLLLSHWYLTISIR